MIISIRDQSQITHGPSPQGLIVEGKSNNHLTVTISVVNPMFLQKHRKEAKIVLVECWGQKPDCGVLQTELRAGMWRK